jgi:hypothetical protein
MLILLLELPSACACLAAGWRGPYEDPAPKPRVNTSEVAPRAQIEGTVGCLGLARR